MKKLQHIDTSGAILSLAEQRLVATLPTILGLQEGEDLLFGGSSVTISVGTEPFSSLPIDFLTRKLFAGKLASARQDIDKLLSISLLRLAQVRAWRHVATEGPPASLLPSDLLWDALARSNIVLRQHLIDRVHRSIIEASDGETESVEWPIYWSTTGNIPELVKECAGLKPHVYIGRLHNNRWLAGRIWPNAMQVTCYARDELVILRDKPLRHFIRSYIPTYEIRTKNITSATVASASVGRRVQDVFEEPVIASLGGTIVAVKTMAKSMRFRVSPDCAAAPPVVADHLQQLSEELGKLLECKDAVAAELKRALHRV